MRTAPENNLPGIVPAPPALAWLETFAITIALPLLGLWLWPEDALFVYADFPWLIMAPLLAGIRYGFVYGFTSALMLILGIAVAWREQLLPIVHFPAEYSLGLLIVGMLAGEFCDMWIRRTRRLAAAGDYQRIRTDEFTRAYHLLKVSHDRLEHRLAANTQSLREALHSMRRRLLAEKPGKEPLQTLGNLMLGIFSNYGHLQVATLHAVGVEGDMAETALASLGTSLSINITDALLVEALRLGQMTSVRAHPTAQRGDDHRTALLAAIPVVDVSGRIWAMVAVHEMPFMAFHEDNLKLLAVLGGHMGDILAAGVGGPDAQDTAEQDFMRQLRRSIEDARRYKLPAMIVRLTFEPAHAPAGLAELIVERRRGLDQLWLSTRPAGTPLVLLLMPLTDALGTEGYIAGLERLIRERYGLSMAQAGVVVQSHELSGKDTVEGVMGYLGKVRESGAQGAADGL
ncbi:MAG: histidine kinase [Gammaproteobacteria bacterium]|nr:histidine kinase [Gammaproteobacteria bacterium]